MRKSDGWVKTFVAALAAATALSAVLVKKPPLTDEEVMLYGEPADLPGAICSLYVQLPDGRTGSGTAFLVDERRDLYVTASHIMEQGASAYIRDRRDWHIYEVRDVWLNVRADLAVFRVQHGRVDVVPLELAASPPLEGQVLYAAGYHFIFGRNVRPMPKYGFSRQFMVVEPVTDHCVDERSCRERDEIMAFAMAYGFLPSANEVRALYPFNIYAIHDPALPGASRTGLVLGLSGGPLMDAQGIVYGINSRYYDSDSGGNHGMFAPAYEAGKLLEYARVATDAEMN